MPLWGGRPGIGGGFDSSHCPVVETFDRFNGLSSNILLTFICYFDIPQMPWCEVFEHKQLNIDKCIISGVIQLFKGGCIVLNLSGQ